MTATQTEEKVHETQQATLTVNLQTVPQQFQQGNIEGMSTHAQEPNLPAQEKIIDKTIEDAIPQEAPQQASWFQATVKELTEPTDRFCNPIRDPATMERPSVHYQVPSLTPVNFNPHN